MTSSNAAKGNRFELVVRRFLEAVFGRLVRRPRQEGLVDVGDIHLSPFVLQCKDYATVATALREGVAGAEAQALAAEEAFGLAVIKARGKGVEHARVAMTLATFRRLAARLARAESLLAHHAPAAYAEHGRQCQEDS